MKRRLYIVDSVSWGWGGGLWLLATRFLSPQRACIESEGYIRIGNFAYTGGQLSITVLGPSTSLIYKYFHKPSSTSTNTRSICQIQVQVHFYRVQVLLHFLLTKVHCTNKKRPMGIDDLLENNSSRHRQMHHTNLRQVSEWSQNDIGQYRVKCTQCMFH